MRMTVLQHKQKRLLIGVLGLVLLAIGAWLTFSGATGAAALDGKMSSIRLGLLCCLIWLAYPELIKIPAWLIPAAVVAALAIYRWPKFLALVPIIAGVCWLPSSPAPNGRHCVRHRGRKIEVRPRLGIPAREVLNSRV